MLLCHTELSQFILQPRLAVNSGLDGSVSVCLIVNHHFDLCEAFVLSNGHSQGTQGPEDLGS